MAHPPIIYVDSFAHYATADLAKKGWGVSGPNLAVIHNSGGRGGRGYLQIGDGSLQSAPCLAARSFPSSTVAIASLAFRATPLNYNRIVALGGYWAQVDSAGSISVNGAATGFAVSLGAWNHFALRVTPTHVTLWLNETQIYDAAGSFSPVTSVTLQCGVTGYNYPESDFADFVLMASSGADVDPLGDRAVTYLAPTGAGAHADFTPNTGANYAAVDEANEDGDTTYVASSTVGQRDSYSLGDLPAGAAAVDGVKAILCAKKTDAGTRAIARSFRIGATDYDGTGVNLGTDYVYLDTGVVALNPATGVAWAAADVNGMELGMEVSA